MIDGNGPTGGDQGGASPAPATTEGASSDQRLATLYPDDVPDADGAKKAQVERPDEAERQKQDEQAAAPEYDLKMPDGVELDRELLTEATPVLRELGLTSDQANKLVPLVTRVQDRLVDGFVDEHTALKADWAKQTKADPSIGGKSWPETERLCALALNAGGAGPGSEVRELLTESGLGNHPAFVKMFRTLGHQLAGKGRGGKGPSRTEILYPDDVPKTGMGAG